MHSIFAPLTNISSHCFKYFLEQSVPPPPANRFIPGDTNPDMVPQFQNVSSSGRSSSVYVTGKHNNYISPIALSNVPLAIEVLREIIHRYIPVVEQEDAVLDLPAHCGNALFIQDC